jgi:protein SCO1/2
MGRLLAGAVIVVVIGLLGGSLGWVWFNQKMDLYADCRSSTVGGVGRIGGSFTLIDQNGRVVKDTDVITKPSLVYFGYTYCSDVCSLDVTRNAEAIDILDEQGFETQPVFISLDPDRDTPDVLKEFVTNIDDRMIALTGTPEQVAEVSHAYHVYSKKQEGGDPEFYMMDHSNFTYLVLPRMGFVDFFRRDDSAEKIADRTACYLSK